MPYRVGQKRLRDILVNLDLGLATLPAKPQSHNEDYIFITWADYISEPSTVRVAVADTFWILLLSTFKAARW